MKTARVLLLGLLIVTLLSACQAVGGSALTGISSSSAGQLVPSSQMQTQMASGGAFGTGQAAQLATATPTAEPTQAATPLPTATTVSQTAAAEQAAQAYFTALQQGDFSSASKLVSAFSLLADEITAGDVADTLAQEKTNGAAWSGMQIEGSQVFDDKTVLVHVTYQLASKDAKTGEIVTTTLDEQWPFRLEQNKWLYNWKNIIDFKTLSSEAKLVNGLTIKPIQLTRYSDKISLTVLAQNGTASPIVIGGKTNQLLGTFTFGSTAVDAQNTRYILDSYRSYTNVMIDVMGLYTSYPDSVQVVKYQNTTAAPWFTFVLAD